MRRVYFQPVGDNMAKYEKCMNTPIDINELKGLINEEVFKELETISKDHTINLWGVANGKDGRTKTIWESMDIHDEVIFTSHRTIWSSAKVYAKDYSEKVSKKYLDDKGYGNIYFVIDRKNIDVPTKDVVKDLKLKTTKIDSTNIVRRFDGMGLSKNEKIVNVDSIDNEKLLNYLDGKEAKANIDIKAAIKREEEEKAKEAKNKLAPKTTDKQVHEEYMKESVKPAPKKTTVQVENKPEEEKKQVHEEYVATTTEKQKTQVTPELPKKAESKPKESVKPAKAESNDTLRVRPITNLSAEEQQKVLEALPNLQSEISNTFSDKYYVLDNGVVIMIPKTNKEFKKIKKYLAK